MLYEVRIATYTRVECESAEQAEAYAQEALGTVEFEGLDTPGEFHSFSVDDVSVLADEEPCDSPSS